MKRFISSLLVGVIFAFWIAQIMVFLRHGFSFTVVFNIDTFFVIRIFYWAAILIFAYYAWQLIMGRKFETAVGRCEIAAFLIGVVMLIFVAIILRSLEATDYKVFRYLVVPKLFVIALASFWILVILNIHINKLLHCTSGTQRARPPVNKSLYPSWERA